MRLELRTEHGAQRGSPRSDSIAGDTQRPLPSCGVTGAAVQPALKELRLSWRAGLHDEPVNIREMIPSMALVTKLTIYDDRRSLLSGSEAEPLNAALLVRLPKLTREHLVQD